MGLDVYLHHCADREAVKALENEYQTLAEAEWTKLGKTYGEATEAEKDAITEANKATAQSLGLTGEYQTHPSDITIDQPSAKYPEHLFHVGYFRSSYNGGGINSVMRVMGLSDLYDIIPATDRPHSEFVPDWIAVKSRCADAIFALKQKMNDPISQFFAFHVRGESFRPNDMPPIKSQEEALTYFDQQQLQRWTQEPKKMDEMGMGDYSNAHGYYSRKGLTVHALISGRDIFSPNGVWVLAKGKDGEHRLTFYLEALEIVEETCDFVLSKPDPQNYYLSWSS